MITDKEYPATHSMATSWYMVDADGNVGLMAFDDNGPVPEFNHVQPDLGLSDLVFGQGFSTDETCKGIHLNMSQIHELLGQPRKLKYAVSWFDVCLAIEPERTAEFLNLCENNDIINYGCVSPEMNLFFVDVFKCIDSNDDSIILGSTLDKMIRANIIKAAYQMPELDANSEYNKETQTVEYTKNFDNTPYYIYCQPYWTSHLQHRMNIPSSPVKITQLDEEYRELLLHVPVRFKDEEDIQIAQWFVCDTRAQKLVIDDAGYSLFPIDKNTDKYCLTNPFVFDYYAYCPEKGYYKCVKCNWNCASTVRRVNSVTPTVMYIADPASDRNFFNQLDLSQEIKDRVAVFSYIPKFPHKESKGWMFISDMKKHMTIESLSTLLSSSRGWFEMVVKTINPQVIIIDNKAVPVFASVFPVTENKVRINDTTYPIFKASAVKGNIEQIIALAKLPYRGKVFRMTYTEQEVDELKQQGKAYESEFE